MTRSLQDLLLTNFNTLPNGYTGSAGAAGDTGSVGYTGSIGDIGYTGSIGDIGYTGSIGDIGYTGSIGNAGSIGYTGSNGELTAAINAGQGGNYTVDLALGNYFIREFDSDATITVTNAPAAGVLTSFMLDMTNAGDYSITLMPGVLWSAGIAPQWTSQGRDVVSFYTYDSGSTWIGLLVAKDLR